MSAIPPCKVQDQSVLYLPQVKYFISLTSIFICFWCMSHLSGVSQCECLSPVTKVTSIISIIHTTSIQATLWPTVPAPTSPTARGLSVPGWWSLPLSEGVAFSLSRFELLYKLCHLWGRAVPHLSQTIGGFTTQLDTLSIDVQVTKYTPKLKTPESCNIGLCCWWFFMKLYMTDAHTGKCFTVCNDLVNLQCPSKR